MEREATDPFLSLPNELCIEIMSLLIDDLSFFTQSVAVVCSRWAQLASSHTIWKKIARRRFGSMLRWIDRDINDPDLKSVVKDSLSSARASWTNGFYVINQLKGHKDFIRCVRFDERNLAVSSGVDRTVRVWDLKTGACLHTLEGHTSEVDSVDFAGDTIASGAFDSTIRLWSVETGQCTNVLKESGHVLMWCVKLFPETQYVLCPGKQNHSSLTLWDSQRGEVLHRYASVNASANTMCLYAEGTRAPSDLLLTGSSDKVIRLWDGSTGLCTREFSGHGDSIWAVHYSHGSVISASSDKKLKLWDLRSGECTSTLVGHMGTVFCMWADAGYIISGDSNDWIHVWDIRTQTVLHKWREHDGGVRSLQHDNYKLVSASWDKTIKVWNFL